MSADPRLTLARPDLADAALEGLARAARFEAATPRRLASPAAAVRAAPRADAERLDELIFGERFDVLETRDGFCWGQAARDGYVGWVEASVLADAPTPPTHRVRALRTFAFAEPSIKSPATGPYSLNALARVIDTAGSLRLVEGAGWVSAAHLAEIGRAFEPAADVAERFLGAPYLWGGRTSVGLDCSGLVQQALYAAGLACPRDTDLQAALGAPTPPDALARGDLVFWRGHVGMMLDGERLLHANAHHMAVVIEPLAQAIGRIAEAGGGEPTAWRRVRAAWAAQPRSPTMEARQG